MTPHGSEHHQAAPQGDDHRFCSLGNALAERVTISKRQTRRIQPNARLTSSQQTMGQRWEEHLRDEFALGNVDKTMETMVDEP